VVVSEYQLCLRHPEEGADAPVSLHAGVDSHPGLRSSFLGNFLQLAVITDETGDENADDGQEGEEDEEDGEAGGGETDPVHDLLRHDSALEDGHSDTILEAWFEGEVDLGDDLVAAVDTQLIIETSPVSL